MMPEPAPRPETAEGKEEDNGGVREGTWQRELTSSHQRIINYVVVEGSACVQGKGRKKRESVGKGG